jgi:Siphovirus Gp157
MKQSIFQISTELNEIINQIIDGGGELTPELEQSLMIKEEELSTKSVKYGYVVKALEYDVNIIDDEIKRLSQIKKVRQNTAERLKNVLKITMQSFNIPEIDTPTMKINFRKSSSLEITDEDLIPKKFVTIKQTSTIRKADIKKAIKEGEDVAGARVIENQNLQIK